MRKKLPATALFRKIDKKVIASLSSLAKKSGYDEPNRGTRYYSATQMTKSFILYYLKQMNSLDDLECYLGHDNGAKHVCNFQNFAPSRSTLSRFRKTVGSEFFEELFTSLLKIWKDKGLLLGRISAVDSSFIKARSARKGDEKPELLEGKSCEFARVGRTHDGFKLGYKLQIGVMTRYEMPVAAEIYPGNHSDYRGLEPVLRRMDPFVTPAIITADGGYFSEYHCNLVADYPAMCLIKSSKTRKLEKHKKQPEPKEHKVPDDDPSHRLKEGSDAFKERYKDRMSVERVISRAKEHFMLDEPRVTGREPVRQHVFISLCALLLTSLACYNMGKSPMKSGVFRV